MTGGSADGNVMVFFQSDERLVPQVKDEGTETGMTQEDDNFTKIVTTALPYLDGVALPCAGAVAGSLVYALASNETLEAYCEYNPTLVMFYDRPLEGTMADFGYQPVVCRLEGDKWVEIAECYAKPHTPFVAVPLQEAVLPNLWKQGVKAADGDRLKSEFFQLYWKPIGADSA